MVTLACGAFRTKAGRWLHMLRVWTHKFEGSGASTGTERQGEWRKAGFIPG